MSLKSSITEKNCTPTRFGIRVEDNVLGITILAIKFINDIVKVNKTIEKSSSKYDGLVKILIRDLSPPATKTFPRPVRFPVWTPMGWTWTWCHLPRPWNGIWRPRGRPSTTFLNTKYTHGDGGAAAAAQRTRVHVAGPKTDVLDVTKTPVGVQDTRDQEDAGRGVWHPVFELGGGIFWIKI